jgi:putative ABC transport system permease protein
VRAWTSLVGSVLEAWQELRIHRTRVLLSLIGVAVAVCAITSVVGLGAIAEEATTEGFEANGGQPANLQIQVNSDSGSTPSLAQLQPVFDKVVKRYKVKYASQNSYASLSVQFVDGAQTVDTRVVDPPFAVMHRISVSNGSWFAASDENRLAPALVVNSGFYKLIGSPDLRRHPTVTLLGGTPTTAVIIGVVATPNQDDYPSMYILPSAFERVADDSARSQTQPLEELWVPPHLAKQLGPLVKRDIKGHLDGAYDVSVSRQDYRAYGGPDPLLAVKLVVGGVAGLVLLLGALGLVNISMVTVRQRVREIGIRRSFGATAGRVFFAVMMESVVATVAAGVIGVVLAVLIVENPITQGFLAKQIIDVPAFPLNAAFIGLACSAGVGAIAGLLPALVAVRVKVIDAIRF